MTLSEIQFEMVVSNFNVKPDKQLSGKKNTKTHKSSERESKSIEPRSLYGLENFAENQSMNDLEDKLKSILMQTP